MRIVVALGGNAMLRRGEPMTADNQRRNIRTAAKALAEIAEGNELIITHGSGPQIGMLALQSAAQDPDEAYPLDVLDAEAEGMIGYLIEQELTNELPGDRRCAVLLTQIEVDPRDPAFQAPSKPIGPVYGREKVERLAREHDWHIAPDGDGFRRVVASPQPQRILELPIIELLVEQDVIVICAGGGGIPTVRLPSGNLCGIEAVIDKDHASALLATCLEADAYLMLTDAASVVDRWGEPDARAIRRATPAALSSFSFAPGSMGPKIEAACRFANDTGGLAGIGRLTDAAAILTGEAGTVVAVDGDGIEWRD